MMAAGRAGWKENCFTVSSRESWDGSGAGAMGCGTGRQEMPTARNSLPFMAGIRRILIHLAILQHRILGVRGATIKGKHPCKGVQIGVGRGEGPDPDTGVGGGAVDGVGTVRTGDGGAGRVRGEGGVQSLRGRGGQPVVANTVQPHPFPTDDEGRSVSLSWPRSSKRHRTILRGPALFYSTAHRGILLAFQEVLSYCMCKLVLQHG